MDVPEKLGILTDAAKYDAACTSSGARRGFRQGYIGSTSSSGVNMARRVSLVRRLTQYWQS